MVEDLIYLLLNTHLFSEELEFNIGLLTDNLDTKVIKNLKIRINSIFQKSKIFEGQKLVISYYDDMESIMKDFRGKDRKLDILGLLPNGYFKYSKELKQIGKNFWIFRYDSPRLNRALLIANKKSGIKSIKDIKNKRFTSYVADRMGRIWVDNLSLEGNKKGYKDLISFEREESRIFAQILKVFFKEVDFTILSEKSWDTMKELNPSITKKIDIIARSDELFFLINGMFHKDVEKKIVDMFKEFANNRSFSNDLNEALNTVKFHKIEFVDVSYFDKTENFHRNYIKLKNSVKK